MKLSLLALLTLTVYIAPLDAQTANCSSVQLWETGSSSTFTPDGTTALSETVDYTMSCYNQNLNNKVYYTANMSVTATGSETIAGAGNEVSCNPIFRSYPYVSPQYGAGKSNSNFGNISGQNRIANPGAPPGSIYATGYCYNGTLQTVTRYCSSVACTNPNNSPILLDTDGHGFFLTNAENGVAFNISGAGVVQMSWTAPNSTNAFLALPGIDGLVHSGKELFGNFTPQPPSDDPNGFAALAIYDLPANGGNGDGVIDSRDAIFSSLRLWIDVNHDGISQPEELHTLPSLGVNSISLKYTEDRRTDQFGNQFRYRAQANPDHPDQVAKWLYDVFFVSECVAH